MLELAQQTGIGAQFGGKYFCHDVRVDPPAAPRRVVPGRRSRCRARPTARRSARSPSDGVFLEQLETDPAKYLPEVDATTTSAATS